MSDNTSLTNPWNALSTVTTFDRGNDAKSTICLENENNQNDRQVVSIVTTTSSLLIVSLVKQLCILFEDDSVCRNELYIAICNKFRELKLIDGSYNVMELEPLRSQYQQALYHLFTVIHGTISCKNIVQVSSSYKSSVTEWSRYHREFKEISFIAGGGFGNVFKALHRLDGIEYAIKKIKVRSDRIKNIMQHLKEVKTLAKLNHTNIVSYKGAWIESRLPSIFTQNLVSSNHFQSKLSSIEYNKRSGNKSHVNRTSSSQSQQSSDTGSSQSSKENGKEDMLLQHSKRINCKSEEESEEKTNSNSISFRNDSELESNKAKSNTNYTDGSNSCEESNKTKIVLPRILRTNDKYATLYIQMALCEKTLQQWLDERMEITPQAMIIAILSQILQGLDYIHSRGIVHHDIKPSNIFISTSERLQIQLGDFGLACPLRSVNHSSIIGTRMYAAPEQLQGKCDPKSDVYSVGIVLLELLIHTRTHMEKIEIINSLKRGHIPTTLAATHPKWACIVSQLIQEDPRKRPSTNQLLQDLNEDKDVAIARLKNDIIKKDNVIRNLQLRILVLEKEIVKHNTQDI